ncbi:TIGR02530 family flagellar biosynthesis protein [Clostridium lacusfryxellense]|uniref:TIGR02530 family flagellar biosynthesis protein n=1 Tax=Clostridium lacusfryxellense TaxID=205328 RepID=UPI001C0C6878|nr:TIGR02530 family flagellar biosynthesis protein [Clostridium lacusfryxellense]MBU3111787.1 flagellar biosynthesis protein [Clostridium lacusfryxellense]
MSYRVINGKLYSNVDFTEYSAEGLKSKNVKANEDKNIFSKILDKQIKNEESFTISSHAAQRLNSRNIDFNDDDLKKINEGINMANKKGVKQSLIMYKDMALITSIKNRTVITALDKNESQGKIITNIDSVVMI